jgi:ascorbate-specific PTS system EIIC-type component UlaA
LLREIAITRYKLRDQSTILGFAWSFLHPLIMLGLLAMINPMVGWIWIATGIMALGGVIALLPRRAAVALRPEPVPLPAASGAAAEGSR